MKTALILQSQTLGPFNQIETLPDRLRCDGVDYPFTVIGAYTLSTNEADFPPPPASPPAPVPATVSPRQFRQALNAAGLRASVEAAVASADIDTQDWWEYATSIDRDNGPLNAAATALGVSSEQLDDLFRAAAIL